MRKNRATRKTLPCVAAMRKIKGVLETEGFTMLELCQWVNESDTNYSNFIRWINRCLQSDCDCKRCELGI